MCTCVEIVWKFRADSVEVRRGCVEGYGEFGQVCGDKIPGLAYPIS